MELRIYQADSNFIPNYLNVNLLCVTFWGFVRMQNIN